MFENEWFPEANSIGVSWEEFWKMNPKILKLLSIGHRKKLEEMDYLSWLSGQYMLSAVITGVERVLAGKKAKSKYINEPILTKAKETLWMTEEEKHEKEIREAIMNEEKWIISSNMKGLPKTRIA